MLDQIKIASPCTADWESMEGDDRVRFCAECQKRVYNLSAMTRSEAESLLQITNGQICAKLYRRADGTVLTEDCPVGLRVKVARVRRRLSWAISGALSFATAFGQDAPVLSGIVEDVNGAVVPRVIVTAIEQKTGRAVEIKTNEIGKFTFSDLPSGKYTIRAASPGFATFTKKNIDLKTAANLNITLQIGAMGDIVIIEPAQSKIPAKIAPKP